MTNINNLNKRIQEQNNEIERLKGNSVLREGVINTTKEQDKNFMTFVKQLEILSKKTGVILSVNGGVTVIDMNEESDVEALKKLKYTKDISSGDLEPLNFFSG